MPYLWRSVCVCGTRARVASELMMSRSWSSMAFACCPRSYHIIDIDIDTINHWEDHSIKYSIEYSIERLRHGLAHTRVG